MNLNKGDKVLCVENNSTVRPLVIESVGDKIVFSKQLDKGVKRTFSLKEGSFQLIKPRYISEHEKKEYKNPNLEMNDRVKVIHVEGTDNTNLLGRDGIVISIKENERGDREIMLYMEDTQQMGNLELEYRMWPSKTGQDSLSGKLIQKSLVLKLDGPKAKQEDYIEGLLHIPEQTEEKKEKISPDLEVGDRIMAWDISPDYSFNTVDFDGSRDMPSTFIATVTEVMDIYNPRYENGIKYLVKLEDTDEVVGLYGGEWAGGSIHPIRNMYQKGTRDKWLKIPKLGITEQTDIFGQGLLDPIEPEEFEGEDEEWEKMVGNVEEPENEPTYDYEGGKTDPSIGFVAPSSDVTDNICKVKGFCEAQGPITFGQLRTLVETATKKRIAADMGRGAFKTLWRLVPFFIPQLLLAAVGVTATRAINKIVTPALKDTGGYKSWWGKVVLKAMDVAEGDYVPDVALGDDPLMKIFFVSDGLLEMIRDKYKLKFARYVADYAAARPDNEPVPEWFVENLLRDYLNQKFLLDPPFEPKSGTDFQALKEHDETDVEVSDNESYQKEFTKSEVKVLNYLSNKFGYEELTQISSTDETEVPSELQKKWADTIKLFGERTDYVGKDDYWVKSSRWAKWAVDNWDEACDGPDDIPCDFKDVTNPVMETPKMYRVTADESMWEKIFRSGEAYVGGFDEEDVEDRADSAWYNYDVDMETYDYGDTDHEELDIRDPEYLHDIMEHKESIINPELEENVRGKVQEIVDKVYPYIVNKLGPSKYFNEPPTVELWKDIYARVSGVEGMEGEHSSSSKAQFDEDTNIIYVYYPNMEDVEDIIKSLLHEYTHHLQDPDKREENRKDGYGLDPDEIASAEAELEWEDYLIYLKENINEQNNLGNKLTNKFLTDFWSQYRNQVYSELYNTYHPSAYIEGFNRPSSQFENALEVVGDAVKDGKRFGLLDSSVDWSDMYDYNDDSISHMEDTGEMPPNIVTDDNGLPTLRDQLEILDNTNLDWIHGILLFDVLEDIVDEFKSYCGENGVDESGMGKCMDEFPPSPDHEQINRTGGTLKQDYYTLYNFMKELERTGVNVKDYMKSPIFPNIIKLVDDGTTDYNATGEYSPMRQDSETVDVSERISEHKESKINPDLEVGDKILVVNVNREVESNSIKYHIPPPELKPDLYVSYAVVEKESNGSESKYPFRYTLIPEDRHQDYLNGDYMLERNTAKLLFPWIYDWILDDEDIITEHKESKINPELRVGDIVRVIDVDGEHARMPKRFETYKVVNVGSSYDEYYDIVSYPEPGIIEGQSILSLYRGDTWIYGDIPMATGVDRKTISENWRDTSWEDDDGKITIGDVTDYIGDNIRNISVSDLENKLGDKVSSVTQGEERIMKADLQYPIILVQKDGEFSYVLDGNHRLAKAIMTGEEYIKAKVLYLDDKNTPEEFKRLLGREEVTNETISEHKETKLNPELMVGDEILVVSTEGVHDFGAPELYKPYVVVGIKHGTTMMKGGKELEDYPYYQVEPVGMTDEERTGAMLAGGGRMKPMYIFPRQDQWILRPGFLRGEHLTEEKESGGVWDYIFGDSIAVGLSMRAGEKHPGKTGIEMRSKLGWSREGATPQEILKNIKEFIIDNDLTNKKVLLSSGYSNSQDLNSIRNEIDVLRGADANVYLLGVSHTFPKEGDHNDILEEIANEKGVTFLGGFDAPRDEVHPSYGSLYNSINSINEHEEGKNMKGFTPKLIGYLKFMFGTKNITNVDVFQRESRILMGTDNAFSSTLYLMLLHNKNKHNFSSISDLLSNLPSKDYEIPLIYEYEVVYFGAESMFHEPEECDGDGYGEYSGEECDCNSAEKAVEDEEGYVETEVCDDVYEDDCECVEWKNKEYEMYTNDTCRKVIFSLKKLEGTDIDTNYTYGYDEIYELEGELGAEGLDWIVEYDDCDQDYDDASQWDYFNDKEGDLIGLDTEVWEPFQWDNYFTNLNKQIYGVKSIEEQHDMVSQRDKKMTELTSQIFNILDENFAILEHPEGELEYEGKNMGLYSYENDSFVPFEHIYNPIVQMLEGGIQQEDIEVFVEIMTNWVSKNMTTPVDRLNEEVNIKSKDSNYSQEDYKNFVDFAHKELKIKDDCPIDVETEPSSEYTTGNYHIQDRKIKILDNGRKLADILRTIAHELVHHKQNELGMLVGEIPEIGGTIEDQANAYAGRLVKKYGKQTEDLYIR